MPVVRYVVDDYLTEQGMPEVPERAIVPASAVVFVAFAPSSVSVGQRVPFGVFVDDLRAMHECERRAGYKLDWREGPAGWVGTGRYDFGRRDEFTLARFPIDAQIDSDPAGCPAHPGDTTHDAATCDLLHGGE
jgi:hypothetical protein